MTSTSFNIGLAENTRNSSKVLKPPGGGTSELFTAPDQLDSPRKPRTQPSVLMPLGDPSPTNGDGAIFKSGTDDSHNRLFGPPEPYKAGSSDRQKSSFQLGDEVPRELPQSEAPEVPAGVESVTTAQVAEVENVLGERKSISQMPRNCVTGDGCEPQNLDKYSVKIHRQRDGNPVTGEGYDTPKSAGTPNTVNGNGPNPPAPAGARRVPPGGFSSGLW